MKILNQEQLLSEEIRRYIIKNEIYGEENRERKAQALRRHEILKGKSKKWVMFGIEKEGFRPETVEQMRSRASNIPVARKINNKVSQAYSGGVTRTLGEPVKQSDGSLLTNIDQMAMDDLYDILDFNTHMKKVDRFRNGFQNCIAGIVPVLNADESLPDKPKYDLKFQVLAPWKYDVIEDPNDPTKILAVIISEFTERICFKSFDDAIAGANGVRTRLSLSEYLSDGYDQAIADAPEDAEQNEADRRFIWWTSRYHFTTDIRGRIVGNASPNNLENFINKMPWVNFAKDQDGSFWAEGGDDIFETDLLINKKQTDCNFIQFIQGWGQMVVDAEGELPKRMVGGPDNAWIFQRPSGAAPAQVTYVSSNPPIQDWMDNIRMILALCLSTNNLSTRNIAAKLDVVSAPSAVSLMVENSELVPDVEDNQAYYQDKEPCMLEVATAWFNPYQKNGWLTKTYDGIEQIKNSDLQVKFHQVKPPISEKEVLEIMKMEKELGVVTLIDLLKKREPDLTDEQAREKAQALYEEKKQMASLVTDAAKEGQSGDVKELKDEADSTDDETDPEDSAAEYE